MGLLVQKNLFQYVDDHIAFYVGAWLQLHAQLKETIHYTDSQKILGTVIAAFQQRGISTQILSEQLPLIYAELPAEAPSTLLFYQRFNIHTPELQDLEAIAALLSALEVWEKVLGQVPVNIKWLLDGSGKDNSILSQSLEEHSDRLQADACIWNYARETGSENDTTPILALGTKGQLSTELEVRTASTPIDIMHGAIAPNALWRLLWALNSLKDAQEDVKIEGFYDTVTVLQDETIAALYTLPEHIREQARLWGMQQFLLDLKGFQLHYTHQLMPTCTVTAITSDIQSDASTPTIPAQAKAQLDFHLVPDQDPQDIFAKLQQHLQTHGFQDIQARMLYGMRPTITALSDPFVQMVTRATEKAYGQTAYLLPITIGSYALYPLRMKSEMPIVLTARNKQTIDASKTNFAATIKQIILIIEEIAHATNTAQ